MPQHNNRQHSPNEVQIDLGFSTKEKNGKNLLVLNDDELFDATAKHTAQAVKNIKNPPEYTQVRKFYDKVLSLEKQIIKNEDFPSVYPFIKMLNSKVAYAQSRNVINSEFKRMMESCIKQIKNDDAGKQTFDNFKLFFEAFLGFYKEKK